MSLRPSLPFAALILALFTLCLTAEALAAVASGEAENERSNTVHDPSALVLDRIRVYGERSSLTQDDYDDTRLSLQRVPGGTNLIDLRDASGRSQTLEDALSFQPGLVVQEFFGANDQPRISIRGSGIQSNPQARGIRLLRDGLPVNLADGSYVISAIAPQLANHVAVWRGANAVALGGTTLGGAIDFISPTGRGRPGGEAMLGFGSFGEQAFRASHGAELAGSDLHLAALHSRSDGFREHNEGSQSAFAANLGIRHSNQLETRFYVELVDSEFDIPGPLTAAQLKANPRQVNRGIQPPPPGPQTGMISVGPNVVRDRPSRASTFARFAARSAYLGAHGVFSAGLSYMSGDDVFTSPDSARESISDDFALALSYQSVGDFLPGMLDIGLHSAHGLIDRRFYANEGGERGREFARNRLSATDNVVYIRYQHPLPERWKLTVAAQGVHARRDIDERFATPLVRPRFNAATGNYTTFSVPGPVAWSRSYSTINGRLGLSREVSLRHQLYANISQSFEPPTFLELVQPTGGTPDQGPNNFGIAKLDAQKALTVEVGSRGQHERLKWDIAVYRSRIRDQLLTSAAFFGGVGVTSNYPADTIHQGVELGLEASLFETLPANTRLDGRLVYNFSDFYFDGGEFDGKQIAGVPRHQVQSELRLSHPSGLFLAPNLRWLPVDTPTDHANTIDQEGFRLLGFTAGFRPAEGRWALVIDARNLTNERYAASYLVRERVPNPAPPMAGPEQVTTFQPGKERSVSVELRLNW